MVDLVYPSLTVGFGAIVGTTGYFIRKVFDLDKELTAHVVQDETLFAGIRSHAEEREGLADERHQDLKDRLVRIETKLDRSNGGYHA